MSGAGEESGTGRGSEEVEKVSYSRMMGYILSFSASYNLNVKTKEILLGLTKFNMKSFKLFS